MGLERTIGRQKMPRKPRIEYPGALYHAITRVNHGEEIFREDADRERLIEKIGKYKASYPFFLYAYAPMSNPIHLLLETKEVPLSKIMQGLLQSYTQFYNRRTHSEGHLFQGRYKAILCDKDTYLFEWVR